MNSTQFDATINDKAFCLTPEQTLNFIDQLGKDAHLTMIPNRKWLNPSDPELSAPESSPELTSSSSHDASPASSTETFPTPDDYEHARIDDASSPETDPNSEYDPASYSSLGRSHSTKTASPQNKFHDKLMRNERKGKRPHTLGNQAQSNQLGILTTDEWKSHFNQIKENFDSKSPSIVIVDVDQIDSDESLSDTNPKDEPIDINSHEYQLRETLKKLETNPNTQQIIVGTIPMPSLDAPRPSREESAFIDPTIHAMLREVQSRPSRPPSAVSHGTRSRANSAGSIGPSPRHSINGNAMPRDSMGRKGFGSIRSKLFQGFHAENLQAVVIMEENSPDLQNPLPTVTSPILALHRNHVLKSPYSTKASLKPSLDWSIEERTSLAIEVHQVLSLPQPVLFRPSSLYHRPQRNSILGKNSDWSLFSETYKQKGFNNSAVVYFKDQPIGFWLFVLGFVCFPLWLIGSVAIPIGKDAMGSNYRWRSRCRLASITLFSILLFSVITVSIYHPFWSGLRAVTEFS